MQLGSYEIPEVRLIPDALADLKTIYDQKKMADIKSKDLATILGYAHPTATQFYRRLKSMVSYGLLDGRSGNYQISKSGKNLMFPEDDKQKNALKGNAILSVELWNEIYNTHKKELPPKFWIVLRDVTGVEPDLAQKNEAMIKNWYLEDINHVSEDIFGLGKSEEGQTKGLSSTTTQSNQMSQQMAPTSGIQVISFDNYQVSLPKGDLTKEWEKLKKYMDVKLEGYKYEEPKQKEIKKDTKSAKEIIEEETEKFAEKMK